MKIYKREKYLKKIRAFYQSDIVKVITGIRRCGKSTILNLIIEELIQEHKIEINKILHFNLNEKRYINSITTPKKLENLIDQHIIDENGFYYLFIDEVQNVKGFEKVIVGLVETKRFSIFITGSNSYLLSDEIGTKLTSRYINFEIFPLDFLEYIEMKQLNDLPVNSDLKLEFDEYIFNGGFPKALEFSDNLSKQTYIESVIEEIFDKDIRRRSKIRNKEVFDAVTTYIVNNYGATFSMKNIHNYFVNQEKINIKRDTLYRYIEVLEKAKIIYRCKRFDQKSKKILSTKYKFYLADLSIYFSRNVNATINYGSSLENIFFIYMLSNNYKVSVGEIGKLECDFITRDINKQYAYIQVSYTVTGNQETFDREIRPFKEINDGFPKYLVTLDFFRDQKDGYKHINIIDVLLNKVKI